MPEKSSSQSNVRWGELYPALSALAESEGKTRSEIAREALRAFLKTKKTKVPIRPKPPRPDWTRETIGVRWGSLAEPLIDRANAERSSVSSIARRSVRFFLGHTRVPELKEHMEDMRKLMDIMARIGGNLNQLTFAFNRDGILLSEDLARAHRELKREFGHFVGTLRAILDELERQRP